MQYILTVTVEINDDAAAILDRTQVGGAAGAVKDMARNLLSGPGIKRVTVDVDSDDDAPESDAQRPAREFGSRGAVVASEPRHDAIRARQGMSRETNRPANDGPALIDDRPQHASGRPKNIRGMSASDGGPVREWGERSPRNLSLQGIEVYDDHQPVQQQQPVKRTRERGTSEDRAAKVPAKSAGKANFPVHTRRK